jgi:hypothetical protein
MFKQVTTDTKHLSQIIDMEKPIDIVTNKFIKRLKGFIHQCFKKVKIIDKPDKQLENLYNKRRILRNKKDDKSKVELEDVEKELSDKYSMIMSNKIFGEVKGLEDAEDGGFNAGRLWKLKKKLYPKVSEPPTAMVNSEGNIITSEKDITDEAINHCKRVF